MLNDTVVANVTADATHAIVVCPDATHNVVIARYQEIVNQFNPLFSHIEQIKKFSLLPTTWDAVKADGSMPELTPTMKLKRRVVREKYGNEIDAIYN